MPNTNTKQSPLDAGTRFFAAPRSDIFDIPKPLTKHEQKNHGQPISKEKKKKMRYAAYVRISSEEQVGNFSLDAQKREITAWVTAKGGILVKVYEDEAKSARTADRPAFQQMRKDARHNKFDALVVHKFDRFARNRTDALAVKSLLRYDYGLKVFSVTEPSEDSDGPMGALIEGIMESVADWYSQNLSAETSKGKKERALQGLHNSGAPFGMKKNKEKVLIPDEDELPGLQLAFALYATGKYSDTDIAAELNKRSYKSKRGRPFSKDTIRDMLQNPTYLGKVKYQKYKRNADGSRSYSNEVEWFEGQHEAIIDEELFNRCEEVRDKRRSHRRPTVKYNPYLLREIVFCYHCCSNPPDEKTFTSYGKMRPQAYSKGERKYKTYRCRARELGYDCEQKVVKVDILDHQLIHILKNLTLSNDWRQNITASIGEILGENDLQERLADIREVIERMDMRWDHGFITDEQKYLRQRLELQQELEKLTPVSNDELERAADLVDNFESYWEQCGDDTEAQSELVKKIVERVYVDGDDIVAITLRSNCHLVLGHNVNEPTEYTVDPFISENKFAQSGSDGI